MKRTLLNTIPEAFPKSVREFIGGAKIYDSSCSPEARVYFVDKDAGYYVKTAAAGALSREALMTDYFHKKGFGARMVDYGTRGADFLITERVVGEDCTHARDCKVFDELGYSIGDVIPVDMFPRTGHVESVVCLTRNR